MIITLLIWAYMFPICYILGFGLINLTSASLDDGYTCRFEFSYILTGLCLVTLYSQLFSLVSKVGLWANVVLIVLTVLVALYEKEHLIKHLSNLEIKKQPKKIVIIAILILLFAYGSSTGIIHYDTDLYHAQSIRWIEEFGVVKGLGNIHTRLAYNSAAFPLTALFSMSFLEGRSFHVCAGFLALIVAVMCIDLFRKADRFKLTLANVVRVAAVYYLLIIFDEMVSPESDYFMVLLTFALFILFFELIESGEKRVYPFAMLTLLGVTVATVKISGALVVLIFAYPVFIAVRDKDIRSLGRYIVLGVVNVLPFVVRNVILSGYLVYPVTGIDIFNVSWKIPKSVAEYDSKEIRVYGRGFADVGRFDEPLGNWIGDWYKNLDTVSKASFFFAVWGLLVLLGFILWALLKRKKECTGELIGITTANICFLFWFFTSPNIRYGCVFLWLAPLLTWGYLYKKIFERLDNGAVFACVVGLLMVFKAFTFSREQILNATGEYLIVQKDYGTYELMETRIDGVLFHKPVEGDRTGYETFPTVPYDMPNAALLGDDIKDGFYTKDR